MIHYGYWRPVTGYIRFTSKRLAQVRQCDIQHSWSTIVLFPQLRLQLPVVLIFLLLQSLLLRPTTLIALLFCCSNRPVLLRCLSRSKTCIRKWSTKSEWHPSIPQLKMMKKLFFFKKLLKVLLKNFNLRHYYSAIRWILRDPESLESWRKGEYCGLKGKFWDLEI